MLNPFAAVRPGERRPTYAAFVVLFGIMSGHALLETARDALFLVTLPPARLAWVYLSIALLTLFLFLLQRGGDIRRSAVQLSAGLVVAAAVDVVFWLLAARPRPWVLYALYTWSGLVVTLLVARFWSLVGEVFGTVGEAKRLYGPIVAGSVLGAIFGSSIARILTEMSAPRHLLLAAAALLLLTALGPWLLVPAREPAAREPAGRRRLDLRRDLGKVWAHPFLRRVAAIVLLSTVTLTLVDFLFKNSVAHHVEPARYATFFASAYLVLNVLSSITQVFLVSRVLRNSRIHRVHAVFPALVMLGSTGLLLGGGFAAALLLKSFDGTLRYSLHRTATEVLYVPLPGEVRLRLRGLLDALGQRGGQVLAALCIFAAGTMGPRHVVLAAAVLALAALWLAVALGLERSYLGVFRSALSDFTGHTRFAFPELNLASLETLMTALSSSNDAEVLAALDVLAAQQRTHVIPALILYHPATPVVVRALELFAAAGRQDFLGVMERLYEHGDAEVRAAALRTRAWVAGPDPALYRRFLKDPSPVVVATALIGIVSSYPPAEAAAARRGLDRLAGSGSVAEKQALARAIRYSPGAGYERLLLQLAESPYDRVRLAVAQAMREIRSPRFIPKLFEMLPARTLREEARATLVAVGSEALQRLDAGLGDLDLDPNIRLHLPRTIMHFPPVQAAPVLLRHLQRETNGAVRYRILKGLGRLRTRDPALQLDETVLMQSLESTLANIFQLHDWRRNLIDAARAEPARGTAVHELILALLEQKRALAMERLFRFVGLLCPGEDVRSLYRGWRNPSRTSRDSSRELLQHILPPAVRDPILALVDDSDDTEMLARAGPYHAPQRLGYEALLGALLEKGGTGMRSLVAYHVGELRLQGLRGTLAALPADTAGLVTRAVERTLALLSAPEAQVADGR
jgi:AAA family ATP:ADP antiporter